MQRVFDKKHRNALLLFALVFLAAYFGVFQELFQIDTAKAISLAIFLIAAILWVTEWLPLFLTSFVILFLQIGWLLPAINPQAGKPEQMIYLQTFFSDITALFLGGFVLAAALHKYGLDNRIAFWLLRKTGKAPSRILFGIMLISAILSMWMSNTATTAMMFAIILPIIAKIPEGNTFSKGLALSIPFSCNLGGLGTPIGTPPNAIAMIFLAEKGISINFGEWMLAAFPFLMLFIVFAWFLLLKMFPPGELEIALPDHDEEETTPAHWLLVAIFSVTVIAWLTTKIHGLSLGTVSLIPVIFIFGSGLLNAHDFRSLPWDVLFMVGGGICLGVGLNKSGLTREVVSLIPVGLEFAWILIAFACLAAFMTTFMSNTATANLLIPIAVSLDHNIALLVISIAMVCSTAMALPVSTPPNAIAFGSGLLDSRDMLKPGAIISIISLFIILSLGALYWPLLGL